MCRSAPCPRNAISGAHATGNPCPMEPNTVPKPLWEADWRSLNTHVEGATPGAKNQWSNAGRTALLSGTLSRSGNRCARRHPTQRRHLCRRPRRRSTEILVFRELRASDIPRPPSPRRQPRSKSPGIMSRSTSRTRDGCGCAATRSSASQLQWSSPQIVMRRLGLADVVVRVAVTAKASPPTRPSQETSRGH